MRFISRLALLSVLMPLASCAWFSSPGPAPVDRAVPPRIANGSFDVQAHRGGRGLLPENTLAAFDKALALGVTTLELDTGITADDQVVISHDATLNPFITRDASGAWLPSRGPSIRSLTFAQLQSYDVGRLLPDSNYARAFPEQKEVDGQRIELLSTLFARVANAGSQAANVRFNIETKLEPEPGVTASPEVFVREILKTIEAASRTTPSLRSRVTIQSFDWRSLAIVQRVAPDIATSYLTVGQSTADNDAAPEKIVAAGGKIWSPGYRNLQARHVTQAHRLGLAVLPWTVNEESDMRRLIDYGVDGIITDYPDRLLSVVQSMK